MADIRRPHTVLGYHTPVQYVDTDTKLTEDFVCAPGFRSTLAEFYPKASAADKARCIELLTSLDIADSLKEAAKNQPPPIQRPYQPKSFVPQSPVPPARPKSAFSMNPSSSERVGPLANVADPYTTSYVRDYPTKAAEQANSNVRPLTTAGRAYQASYSLSGPVGGTTYQHEFNGLSKHRENQDNPATMLRSGTSSGQRRNNPHPLESFIVWKLPRKVTRDPRMGPGSLGPELTDELMDKVCRGQLSSTYQNDYLGIPQGYPVDEVFELRGPDWKARVPYTLDSSSRRTFQAPTQRPELQGHTTRYACNRNKHIPAHGIAPTVPRRHMYNLKSRTTYEREYSDRKCPPTEVRELGKQYGAAALHNYMPRAPVNDQRTIGEMLGSMNITSNGVSGANVALYSPDSDAHRDFLAPSPPSSAQGSYSKRAAVCPTTQVGSPDPGFQQGLTGYISQEAY